MIESTKEWLIEQENENLVNQITEQFKIPRLLAKIIAARSISSMDEVEQLLHPSKEMINDSFLFDGMEEAVGIIQEAIDAQIPILIYGDYDADGVTGTTILMKAIRELGGLVDFCIPNRFTHGYGPNTALFEEKITEGFELIITVDNGIAGIEAIHHANSLGATVIITDHHDFGEELPQADAIIHPNLPGQTYPYPHLAGVGVAYKLATALLGEEREEYLQFVAIGTIADMVPLTLENRYFTKMGLQQLRQTSNEGIKALARVSNIELQDADEMTVGFSFGPRLNAPGRLHSAEVAVRLLLSETREEAEQLAATIQADNQTRQGIVNSIMEQADQLLIEQYGNELPPVIVLYHQDWNPGVVGIVASRLVEKYYRPTILFGADDVEGIAKGSARSIEGFHLFEHLQHLSAYLLKFGGHEMAAGMSIAIDQIESFTQAIGERAIQCLTADQWIAKERVDVTVEISEVTVDTLEQLSQLKPFGMGFAKPNIRIKDVKIKDARKIGADRNHFKAVLEQGAYTLDAVSFHKGQWVDQLTPGITCSVLGDLTINEWNGKKNPQIMLSDLKSEDFQLFDYRGIQQLERWLPLIPSDAELVVFTDAGEHYFKEKIPQLIRFEEKKSWSSNVVLLDLPVQFEQLTSILQSKNVHRMYTVFYQANPVYLETLPTREMFAELYKTLKQRGFLDYEKEWQLLGQAKGWKKDTIIFMLKVFLELKFVKIEDGVFQVNSQPSKSPLEDAPSYQARIQQYAIEKQLLFSSYAELQQFVITMRS